MIRMSGNLTAKIKRTDEKKNTEHDEDSILEKSRNEDPWRKNKEHSYETFDSKW